MSVLERRLQLLLDQGMYDRVAAEAAESGRSVAAVIRQAIDDYFQRGIDVQAAAAGRLLAMTEVTHGVEPDWAETKAFLEADAKLDAIP